MYNQYLKKNIITLFLIGTVTMSFTQIRKQSAFILFVQLKQKSIPIDSAAIQILCFKKSDLFELVSEGLTKRFGLNTKNMMAHV